LPTACRTDGQLAQVDGGIELTLPTDALYVMLTR
jgi:hypothetical protein